MFGKSFTVTSFTVQYIGSVEWIWKKRTHFLSVHVFFSFSLYSRTYFLEHAGAGPLVGLSKYSCCLQSVFLLNAVHQDSRLILFFLWSPNWTTKILLTLGNDDTVSIFCFIVGVCVSLLEMQLSVAISPFLMHLMFLFFYSPANVYAFPLLLLNNEDGSAPQNLCR